ncbi:hypothetical protein HU200_055507 [Digitaria exilis]|uniref:Uncharacterized protein n=1 Tax=Digitaria exilis TaxID=1010633 RepID=A0A835AI69_9POAL|nr:hypothetical protein HU200_055507 [Digitaria exilis]
MSVRDSAKSGRSSATRNATADLAISASSGAYPRSLPQSPSAVGCMLPCASPMQWKNHWPKMKPMYLEAQVLYYSTLALLVNGHETVYDAVEEPLLFAQTAAFVEVKS